MPELEVRAATPADLEGVQALLEEVLPRLAELRGGPALLEGLGVPPGIDAAAFAAALCGNALLGATTLVATLDGAVAGLAVVVLGDDGPELVGVHTSRSLRRRRIGTALLDEATALARDAGATLEALALPGDQSTKSLLESQGYRARLLRMRADR